ncbi:MAG: di-trans,poly-cis-decaprenylcistransferase [Flavobacteriaceae bacterium TMED184]|nr:MAG: di-trans,poly-cis-decaprenylcistransferase [Flavobacteriaceae bacterium TMED184]|tara:strand:+ start:702 stop:1433 length:732 start_codon:yes stop_codon:yes gene_type:complete
MENKILKVPHHLAVIMDGNGRWAKKRNKNRVFGHSKGINAVRKIVEESIRLKIKYLTLYAFSAENWNRPEEEISILMQLLLKSLKNEFKKFVKNKIKLNVVGNISLLPKSVKEELSYVLKETSKNKQLVLTLALSYSGREEIQNALKKICTKVKNNIIPIEKIDQSTINEHLYTENLPDVDLLIRTSGEKRISNFLLWKIAYAELYFSEVLWPDFNEKNLHEAILNYQNRERRFGKTSDQLYK